MGWRENISLLAGNLARLGARRMAVLGLSGLLVAVAVAVSGYILTRPQFEVLYTGLSSRDVSAIGAVLGEARIDYDVSADGRTVKVSYGQTARARMLLAEKGLPRSARAGYELFDSIGALGLTSFMQEVTLVRALEGELARTIQSIAGVKAARVHIVLPKKHSFRRSARQPSASVLVRTDPGHVFSSANAIRYLVAGAVPGLHVGRVTVLNTDGTLLASGEDGRSAAPRRLVDLEMTVARRIRENVRSTLMPYLGAGNFQVSVTARLNTDKRQVSETVFDPASRVERSVRDIKEKTSATNSAASAGSASVDQEIPGSEGASGPRQENREKRDRKERLTNYEISSKRISTVSDGYSISRLSIAVVVNRKSLETLLGRKLNDAELERQRKEIRELVVSAAGVSAKRGDQLKITTVDFIQTKSPLEPVPGPGVGEYLMKLTPVLINALALLGVSALVIWFGVRPAVRVLASPPPQGQDEAGEEAGAMIEGPASGAPQIEAGRPGGEARREAAGADAGDGGAERDELIADVIGAPSQLPLKRLRQMIEYDEKQAAAVLKEWLREENAA